MVCRIYVIGRWWVIITFRFISSNNQILTLPLPLTNFDNSKLFPPFVIHKCTFVVKHHFHFPLESWHLLSHQTKTFGQFCKDHWHLDSLWSLRSDKCQLWNFIPNTNSYLSCQNFRKSSKRADWYKANYKVWKRIGVMVCKKSAYLNCSGALTNCSGRLITVPEDL